VGVLLFTSFAGLGLYTILRVPIWYVEWQGGTGGNDILLNIACNLQREGGAKRDVLNAKNGID